MDAQGIDMAVLSINPNWYDVDRDLATQVIRIQNEASRSSAPPTPTGSPRSPRWRFNSPSWPPSSSSRA